MLARDANVCEMVSVASYSSYVMVRALYVLVFNASYALLSTGNASNVYVLM